MAMTTSAAGRAAIMQREGVRLIAYRDSVGVWTVGVGHTGRASPPNVTSGMSISRAQADAFLANDLLEFERTVNAAVRVPLSQNQFDACVSLAFNIGAPGFATSSVVRRLNGGSYAGAAEAFMLWVRPPELTGRRKAERAQFLTGVSPSVPSPGPLWVPGPSTPTAQTQSAWVRFWSALWALLTGKKH